MAMEQPGMRVVRPANEDGSDNPDHLIIWLDRYIGKPDECVLLKRAFFMTTDPTTGDEVSLNEHDIDASIRSDTAVPVRLDGVQFMLRAFENVDRCYQAIKNNLDKRIFFITSGSKGKMIVPILTANFPATFVPGYRMYVFCANMNMREIDGADMPTNEWAFDYLDNVLMCNHQDDLLARMILDIATYFFIEAERLRTVGQLDSAYQHYGWSKRMWERYEKMEKKTMKAKINEINQRINDIEQQRGQGNTSTNDHISKPCVG